MCECTAVGEGYQLGECVGPLGAPEESGVSDLVVGLWVGEEGGCCWCWFERCAAEGEGWDV